VLETEQTAVFDFPLNHFGQKRHCEARLVKIKADQVLLIARDITEQKNFQDALIEKEHALSQENRRLKRSLKERYRLGKLIGASEGMQQVYDLILEAAVHDLSVMIHGESGTGKELVAQAIHELSDRQQEAFIPVNCGAIPENLIESEFFGYQKGAFTGAVKDNPGYLSRAHKGTLFLDEIGNISLNMQVKLLRVIEGSDYMPLGSRKTLKSDIRFICATNQDPKNLVAQGQMREDFFYRVQIITIELPPLRDRHGDLPLLIEHFYHQFSQGHDDPPPLSGELFDALINYPWPGNVRELQNTLQRYISTKRLDFMCIPTGSSQDSDPAPSLLPDTPQDHSTAMQEFEKRLIVRALEQNIWHREKAAQSLKIPRRTFYRKLKNLGLFSA
jgi:transcriptional regulator with PAS, ATPase and Fis domain